MFRTKVIAISGHAQHGKDTTANLLKSCMTSAPHYNTALVTHFADLLKYICTAFFDWDGQKDESGREMLQFVGTDVIRKEKPDFWVDFIIDILNCFKPVWDFVLIPLSDKAYSAFEQVIRSRPKPQYEVIIDGCSGFLFLDRHNIPKVAKQMQHVLRCILKAYNDANDPKLPKITAHTFRHTFITNMYNRGLDLKSLQSVAGHSNIKTTLSIYTHVDFERVKSEFFKATSKSM